MQTSIDDGQVTTWGNVALGKRWRGLNVVAVTEGKLGVVIVRQGDDVDGIVLPIQKFEDFVAKTRLAIRQSREKLRRRSS